MRNKIIFFIDTNIWLDWKYTKRGNKGSKELMGLLTRHDTCLYIYLPYFAKQELIYQILEWEREKHLLGQGYSIREIPQQKGDFKLPSTKNNRILGEIKRILRTPKIIHGKSKEIDSSLFEKLVSNEFGFADALILANLLHSCKVEDIRIEYFITRDDFLKKFRDHYTNLFPKRMQISGPSPGLCEQIKKRFRIKEIEKML